MQYTDESLNFESLVQKFETTFQIIFKNPSLLIQALKHRSYLIITNESQVESNERLEFLGDSVLELVMTHFLFETYPDLTEGELSKKKSILVSKNVLGLVAKEIDLGGFILLNHGEEKTGGRSRLKLLANTVESIIGAIYLDQGYEKAKWFIDTYITSQHKRFEKAEHLRNFKSELLELAQSKDINFPVYRIAEETGPDHDKYFLIEVIVGDRILAKGSGRSKKLAEQDAAKIALEGIDSGTVTLI